MALLLFLLLFRPFSGSPSKSLRKVRLAEETCAKRPGGAVVELDLEACEVFVGGHDLSLSENGVFNGVSDLEGRVVFLPFLLEVILLIESREIISKSRS